GGTILGEPDRIEDLGESQVPYQLFLEYIFGLGEATYKPGAYDLFKHNCNNFSDEVSQFLCGHGIPKHILQLPDEVLNTDLGDTLKSLIKELDIKSSDSRRVNFANFNNNLNSYIPSEVSSRSHDDSPELEELNHAIDQIRQNGIILEDRRNSINEKIIKKEKKKKDKKEKKEKKEKREKKKKSKSSSDPSEEGKKKKKHHSHIESLDEDLNSPCCFGAQSASHSRHNSEGDFPPQILQDPLQDITDSIDTFNIAKTQVENSSSGEIISIEPEPFERLPSPCSRGASPQPDTQTMSDSVPEVQTEEVAPAAPQSPEARGRDSPVLQPEPEVEREPPILFKDDMDARKEFEGLVTACAHLLAPEEKEHLDELQSYIVEDEGSWALGENFNILFHRIFHDPSIPDEARLHLVRIMAAAALKDDVILLLHQDRKDHTIMNYANKVESLSPAHQESLALFFCNMFEHLSPSEWLLYISEWQEGGQQASNIRVTTKVAVNALLHSNPKVQNYGTALMYNLGTKEVKTVVFDDVAPELAMAILQFFNSHPEEELLWRTMTALCRFCYSSTEVPALIKMIGPEPSVFKGVSERIDAVIEEIDAKLSRVRLF
ncbi:Desumoylating isopeptidase 1, partial [Halocaridina rubra]